MREILFRGKALDSKNIWDVGYLLLVKNNYYIHPPLSSERTDVDLEKDISNYNIWVYEVIPDTIGQYTGLKDKNGTKVFEGDIVALEDKVKKIEGIIKFGKYYQSQFGNGLQYGFYIEWIDKPHLRKDLIYWIDAEVEVIGNIHDNPELLGSESTNEQTS